MWNSLSVQHHFRCLFNCLLLCLFTLSEEAPKWPGEALGDLMTECQRRSNKTRKKTKRKKKLATFKFGKQRIHIRSLGTEFTWALLIRRVGQFVD